MHIFYQFENSDEGDFIFIDASVREVHSAQNEITRIPVERGVDVTDHSRAQPVTLSIDGVISNHPLPRVLDVAGGAGQFQSTELQNGDNATTYQYPQALDRAQTDYQRLLFVKDQGHLCEMVTSLRRYTSMVIESIEVERTAETGNALHFTMRAIQIRVVESQVSEIRRPVEPRGQNRKDRGPQQPKAVDPTPKEAETKSSLLSDLLGVGKSVS